MGTRPNSRPRRAGSHPVQQGAPGGGCPSARVCRPGRFIRRQSPRCVSADAMFALCGMRRKYIELIREIDRRSLQTVIRNSRGQARGRCRSCPIVLSTGCILSHGWRLIAEPESSQGQRLLGLFLRLSLCLGSASGLSSFLCDEIGSANTVTPSELHAPKCRLPRKYASVVGRFGVWNSMLSPMEQMPLMRINTRR